MRVLVIDNYDSFVFNLVQYLGQLAPEIETVVRRNDDPWLADPSDVVGTVDGVIISPGPGTPQRAGSSMATVRACARHGVPLLGVCLGHQSIGAAFGAMVTRAPQLRHGKTSLVHHRNVGVVVGLPDPFVATRYHSLTVVEQTLPNELEPTAWTVFDSTRADSGGILMALQHRELPIHGVQFHPESILTQGGHRMLANWLAECGVDVDESSVAQLEAAAPAVMPATDPAGVSVGSEG